MLHFDSSVLAPTLSAYTALPSLPPAPPHRPACFRAGGPADAAAAADTQLRRQPATGGRAGDAAALQECGAAEQGQGREWQGVVGLVWVDVRW